MNANLEKLIDLALADGILTDKEKAVLQKKADSLGVDQDEFEMILEGKLYLAQKAAAPSPPTNEKPKSNKEGSIKKCPSCGAPTQSFNTKCPECDHEFRDTQSTRSVTEFFKILGDNIDAKSEEDETNPLKAVGKMYSKMFSEGGMFGGGKTGEKERELIKNFPVPNNKEDILEFLSMGVPRARKKGNVFSQYFNQSAWEEQKHNFLVPIWHSKCEQLIIKARFAMKDDIETLEQIEYYAKQLKIS